MNLSTPCSDQGVAQFWQSLSIRLVSRGWSWKGEVVFNGSGSATTFTAPDGVQVPLRLQYEKGRYHLVPDIQHVFTFDDADPLWTTRLRDSLLAAEQRSTPQALNTLYEGLYLFVLLHAGVDTILAWTVLFHNTPLAEPVLSQSQPSDDAGKMLLVKHCLGLAPQSSIAMLDLPEGIVEDLQHNLRSNTGRF